MAQFKYTALDASGAKVNGVIEAASRVRARNELTSQSLQVGDVTEKKGFRGIQITKKKVKRVDLMNFSRQLAAFLRAGIPILDSMTTLGENVTNPVLKTVVADVTDGLRSGVSLSDAMAVHSELFPTYYIGILQSAELTGNLDTVLDQLADYIERDLEARRAVKSAMTYPLIICVMAVLTVIVLSVFVLPKFKVFFDGFNAKLPLPTRMLLGGADFMHKWGLALGGVLILLSFCAFMALRTERGKFWRDRTLLRLPVLGGIVRYATIERFFRILGAMLRAGVPVPEAMAAANEGSNNRVFEQGLANAVQGIMRGEGLSGPLAATGLFPGVAAQMLRVGEDTGTLDRQLSLAADFYQSELTFRMKRLTSLFEPIVILVMGGVVGFVAIALVSAMYGIFNQVKV
jgi:type IV pilus assembly protein PilC